MPITIISDPADSSANAYADEDFAAGYFNTRLHSTNWTATDPETRKAALVQATRMLDRYVSWKGEVASETQPLSWPRNYMQEYDRPLGTYLDSDAAAFPTFLREACCEVAMDMIADDRLVDQQSGISSVGVDTVRVQFSTSDRKDIFSDSVSLLIDFYGTPSKKYGKTVKLVRA